jgi:predicted SAM-dependent methyltransferase
LISYVKQGLRSLLTTLLPIDLVAEIKSETKISLIHFRTWFSQRHKFRGQKNLRLNIGCGSNLEQGWINIDFYGPPDLFRWDCRRGIPFDAESVEAIFAEHVFEHFNPETGRKFLSECYRCLRPGGIARIIVPDAGKYLLMYSGDWGPIAETRPLIEENGKYRDYWLNDSYATKMEFINAIFRQGLEHKYAYDAETLVGKFKEAGFKEVTLRRYGDTALPGILLDTESRKNDSLYVEATRR